MKKEPAKKGRPRKAKGQKLEHFGIRISSDAIDNAYTYPVEIRRRMIENAYLKPYEPSVCREYK
jgi:hypothetical protein